MHCSVGWLVVLLVLAGCRQPRSETGRGDLPAAGDTPAADLQDREPGVEFEAPRLIPAVRAQITVIQEPDGATEGNLTAFRNGVGALVNAMETDLNRVEATDGGAFAALSDSIMREFGGGAGNVAGISPAQGLEAAARVKRLIGLYEQEMRTAAN